jgi:hypothetical protein
MRSTSSRKEGAGKDLASADVAIIAHAAFSMSRSA